MTQSPSPTDTATASPVTATRSQQTLSKPVMQSGIGLHSGVEVQVHITPAPPHTGRVFRRSDLPEYPEIPARVEAVGQTLLSTELGSGAATVRTVEHLLAALVSLGVDNAYIEVTGPEMPLLDGSAQLWVAAIAAAGLQIQAAERTAIIVTEPIWVRDQDAFVVAMPAAETRLTYGIDFEVEPIGNQWHSWTPTAGTFATEIAPARTFGLAHQIEYLRSQGLIKGGSLENALVCDRDRWVNPPLRFENEPVRHKLLDLLGDLSLLGTLPQAHIMAYKASHHLHVQLAKAIATAHSI
ncbi:UDP-3-O-acyl-N-acetylglucosamine deacetylase [Leptolyngbya iicbica]|uniref:UDP-3-O-acyl-N-acetylglucosamine deacetylase n=2 Tax=Cyanophyceae TaxID=3028117 RepID=A0A4Q7EFI3_9CYAN|nr:UDP-3-O-acyl-N-acetylglucosamine deacetylase [Leptolyngbya sp. LK]RZM81776.1 UDP-3-O-acyl-N-acetylglucosamine deacetylase [Leptolyngbya sp. LK]